MPRTKRPVRKQEQVSENNEARTKLDKLVSEWQNKFDTKLQMEIKNIEVSFKILLSSISAEDLNKTVGQLKANPPPALTVSKARKSGRATSHDDGYLSARSTDGSSVKTNTHQAPPSVKRTTARRSRSADASARSAKPAARATTTRRRSRSVARTPAHLTPAYPAHPAYPAYPAYPAAVYQTPAYNKNASLQYPAITPKVAPNTALALLRQPRQGEMVFSMSGSPLMASTINTMKPSEKAHCNIVLQDGTMLSLQPQQLRPSTTSIPFSLMDNNVLHQLKTLKDNLDKVVKMGEKVID